jgi:c-di-GMP-binding flagellar brake protein YcgR
VSTRLAFEGLEGGYECIVMGHDMQSVNLTLPAHNDHLVSSLRPGMRIEGTLESGPSLLAFTSVVTQAVAGSLPYCRIEPWRTAWEVRKRESVRLPISLDIDFQHISTSAAASIQMASLDKEIGALRPGKLVDVSLGGCAIETPSSALFREGDMLRFSKSLVAGNPPATLLGALVKIDAINPEENEGCTQRLHVQFLVIDDVSQRILVRTMRQLQDVADRDEWMKAQQLMQQMRRNHVENIGSPGGSAYAVAPRRGNTAAIAGTPERRGDTAARRSGSTSVRRTAGGTAAIPKPGTRSYPKPPTRSITAPPKKDADS